MFVKNVKQIVILGGAFFVNGNVNPAAEANVSLSLLCSKHSYKMRSEPVLVMLTIKKTYFSLRYSEILKLQTLCLHLGLILLSLEST
jgi:hypothetical protein